MVFWSYLERDHSGVLELPRERPQWCFGITQRETTVVFWSYPERDHSGVEAFEIDHADVVTIHVDVAFLPQTTNIAMSKPDTGMLIINMYSVSR
jgi:hypothetical protein